MEYSFSLPILGFTKMYVFKGNLGLSRGLPELLVKEAGRNAGIKDWKEMPTHTTEHVRI